MPWYYATVFTPDGKPSNVDFGGSNSEATAARLALKVSNQMQRDTCVAVDVKGIATVRQTIRWKGYAAPVETLEVEQETEPRTLRIPLNPPALSVGLPYTIEEIAKLVDFIDKWTLRGKSVTVTRCAGNPGFVNVVASR